MMHCGHSILCFLQLGIDKFMQVLWRWRMERGEGGFPFSISFSSFFDSFCFDAGFLVPGPAVCKLRIRTRKTERK